MTYGLSCVDFINQRLSRMCSAYVADHNHAKKIIAFPYTLTQLSQSGLLEVSSHDLLSMPIIMY